MKNNHHKHYRDLLAEEFANRKEKNQGYSLRAFARDSGLPPSRVSEIFKGTDSLSAKRAAIVAKRLGLPKELAEYFCTLVDKSSRSIARRKSAEAKLLEKDGALSPVILNLDKLAAISQWYHITIFEIAKLHGSLPSLKALTLQLGIGQLDVENAIARLIRLGLLSKIGARYSAQRGFHTTLHDVPSDAVKSLHNNILSRARRALLRQSVTQREFSSCQMPIRKSELPAAKDELRRMRNQFIAKFSAPENGDAIYCFSSQFFDLLETKNVKEH